MFWREASPSKTQSGEPEPCGSRIDRRLELTTLGADHRRAHDGPMSCFAAPALGIVALYLFLCVFMEAAICADSTNLQCKIPRTANDGRTLVFGPVGGLLWVSKLIAAWGAVLMLAEAISALMRLRRMNLRLRPKHDASAIEPGMVV